MAYTNNEHTQPEKEALMPDYRRATRTCPFIQLRPELVTIIRQHLQAQNLGNLIDEALMCCETTTDKIGASWYDVWFGDNSDAISHLALVLTPHRLIWARSSDRSAPTVASAALNDLIVKVFRPGNSKDFGLKLSVRIAGTRGVVNGELRLGPDPAAEKFCVALGEAMGFNLMAPPPKPWWDRLWSR
jgi:hypothetical protein